MFSKLYKIFFLAPFLLFLIIFIFFSHGLTINPQLLPSTLINKPAPSFDLSTLQNPNAHLTQSIFQTHVTLLNVFATWCEICAEEHPVLMDIASSKEVTMIGMDYKDHRSNALAFLKNYGNPFQIILFDHTGQVAINWGVYGTPETFIIDKHGIVRYKQIGPVTPEIWQKTLLPIVLKYTASNGLKV